MVAPNESWFNCSVNIDYKFAYKNHRLTCIYCMYAKDKCIMIWCKKVIKMIALNSCKGGSLHYNPTEIA